MQYKSTTHEEKFFHFTNLFNWDCDNFTQAITVFARKEDDGLWYAAEARCSRVDQFDRRVGRQVARRYYFQKPDNRVCLGEICDYSRVDSYFVVDRGYSVAFPSLQDTLAHFSALGPHLRIE